MRTILLLLTFFTASAFAQEYQVMAQDKGLTIEHPTCRLWVGSVRSLKIYPYDNETQEILIKKGYNLVNRFSYRHDANFKKNDLIMGIDFNKEDDSWLWSTRGQLLITLSDTSQTKIKADSSVLTDSSILKPVDRSESNIVQVNEVSIIESEKFHGKRGYENTDFYSHGSARYRNKAIKSQKEVYRAMPNCKIQGSGLTTDKKSYDFDIRAYEINSCLNNYDQQLNSLTRPTTGKMISTWLGFGMIFGGVLFPPLAIAGASTIIISNRKNIKGVFYKKNSRQLKDGEFLMGAIRDCELLRDSEDDCSEQYQQVKWHVSEKSKKSMTKVIDKMGFKHFSSKVADSLVQNKTCSSLETSNKEKRYKSILKEAKKNL